MAPDAAPAATLALAFTAGLAVALLVTRLSSRRQRPPGRVPPPKRRHEDTTRFKIVKPPLPAEVVGLLRSTSLCHLSTQGNDGGPHLSLMRFTYVQAEEKILISTRRNTAKFEYLSQNPSVALLVHDFPHLGAGGGEAEVDAEEAEGRTYSITLNGQAHVEDGDVAECYRALHLAENPEYEQFIVGQDIAIVSVTVDTARICNIDDKVKYWDAAQQHA
uniref:Pyridoxamine 5'-phosphate oxidase N-terminal domain-containing protein n=1 Tax=Phaeomonas parva TaxID=124430 RepID=A0A7S1U2J8_9STRA